MADDKKIEDTLPKVEAEFISSNDMPADVAVLMFSEVHQISAKGELLDLSTDKGREEYQNQHLEVAAQKSPNNPLLKPFVNQTGIANFGHGSFSGVNVRDLASAVVTGTTQDVLKNTEQAIDQLPLLRYINLPGGSIELRIKGKVITAAKTLNGLSFVHVVTGDALTVLQAISERAMKIGNEVKARNGDNSLEYDEDLDSARLEANSVSEIDKLKSRIQKLETLASCAYQFAGIHDAPANWLDALSQAGNSEDFETDSLLPYQPETAKDQEDQDRGLERLLIEKDGKSKLEVLFSRPDLGTMSRDEIRLALGVKRTCNRHNDCDTAETEAKARLKPGQHLHVDFHCYNDECDECFGN